MYKILFIDDEAIVRKGVEENIDWKSLGFEFVGACENGIEAMEVVEKLQPDVVLTDICMPFMDGLELARNIITRFPHIKVIILTGHDEFEYAQTAVKVRVYDFLLKPITAHELTVLLEKVRTELDNESKIRTDFARLKAGNHRNSETVLSGSS